jgi:glycosyltransferase involved in cell wall biosynthesis
MQILFVTAEYPPMPGGVGAYTAELGKALAALGCEVHVLTGRMTGEDAPGPPTVWRDLARWDWRLLTQIQQRAQALAADWVHVQYQTGAYGMHPAINLAPGWWRWQRRKGEPRSSFQVGWTYHDLRVPYLFPKAGNRLRRWVTTLPATQSNLVIVTNEGDRLVLANRIPNLAKIPIGSNIEAVRLTPDARRQCRAERGYGEHDLVIGYFGLLNPSKGGLTLVRTLAKLVNLGRNAHLLMIGERVGVNDPTNLGYLQTVEAEIERLGLANRVQWTGHQPAAEVGAGLQSCDLLLMPYEDGASLRRGTLMAGLAHGCAIVTTMPLDPLPELVDGRDLLYVPPGDATAAAQAILRLADDPALAAVLRTGAATASQQFTWSRIAQEHLRCYLSCD